ncbi:MAG: hypothetical protein AB1489_40290 [Acidobacteriota bacterium]
MKQSILSWSVFAIFVACAIGFGWHDAIFSFVGVMGVAKAAVWLAFLSFLGYSIYCSSKENLFKSIKSMYQLYWGRQVGIDLYLGLLLSLSIIYLHEHSIVVLVLWFIPILLFANLATLLYVAIHFESLVARFLA